MKKKPIIIVFLSIVIVMNSFAFPIVHSYRSNASGIYSNSYIIELEKGVVVIDATLAVSSGKEVRNLINEIGKPVYAVLLTHGHPDHYNGLTEITKGLPAPIYSSQNVLHVIKQYDQVKEKQWKGTFGDEWPASRTFPNKIIKDGESLTFETTTFSMNDLGPGESHSDSYWVMQTDSTKNVFLGDIVLHKVHAYLSDGHFKEWMNHLRELNEKLNDITLFYPGHGLPGGKELFAWQQQYLETYKENLKPLWADKRITEEEKGILKQKMEAFLPGDKLSFLIGLGAEPTAKSIFN
jgi:glyoxylase-like metal-dependent hydrolase (beta-lactamase superfamily II)